MILGSFILIVALVISAIAAYYSIVGLASIFAAAVIPIVVMASALEVAKISCTVWLHRYWRQCRWIMRVYLTAAVMVLMFITSLGIFGFLSKAHSEQALVAGDNTVMLAEIDRQVEIEKRKIADAERVVAQLDKAVESLSAADRIRGKDGAIAVRNSQAKERDAMNAIISASNTAISQLAERRVPLLQEQLTIESKVGPLKYIAAMVYGDAASDARLLENAVRWVILLLVVVFDPLAVMMVLAAVESFDWAKAARKQEPPILPQPVKEPEAPAIKEDIVEPVRDEPPTTVFVETNSDIININETFGVPTAATVVEPEIVVSFDVSEPSDSDVSANIDIQQVENEPVEIVVGPLVESMTTERDIMPDSVEAAAIEATTLAYSSVADNYVEVDGKIYNSQVLTNLYPELKLSTSAARTNSIRFGTSFPTIASRNELYLRTDFLPTKLYRFDGVRWIEADKNKFMSQSDNTEYIQMLIQKIGAGEYDPTTLSDSERAQIEAELRMTNNIGQ